MSKINNQYYDTHTLFVDCGVATEEQLAKSLIIAINDAEKILAQNIKDEKLIRLKKKIHKFKNKDEKNLKLRLKELNDKNLKDFYKPRCRFKINLLVNKEGEYLGFGYIRITSPEVYWMILGRNPDGSERFEEIPDPNWSPPPNKKENLNILENKTKKTWAELAEEEEAHIQPIIKKPLPPLITIPGYKYDVEQLLHLKDVAKDNGEDPNQIPDEGFFEISRGYVKDPPLGKLGYKLCARKVPDWLPEKAFKKTFSIYASDPKKKGKINIMGNKVESCYPIVNFIDTKKGRIVFITFDPSTKDALFASLMQKKTRLKHPEKPNLKCELIFTHAYDNK